MPDRAIDVGICEQHAVTLSAGMATQGHEGFLQYLFFFHAKGLRPGGA